MQPMASIFKLACRGSVTDLLGALLARLPRCSFLRCAQTSISLDRNEMRILLVSDFFPPTRGGMEAHVRRLAETLIDAGHDVGVVTGTPNPDRLPGDMAINYAPTMLSRTPGVFRDATLQFPPPFPDPAFRAVVRRVSESWRPEVIHAHGWCAFSSYWSGSPPLVVTLHDHSLRCPKRTLLRGVRECATGIGVQCVSCSGALSVVKRVPLAAAMRWSVPGLATRTGKFIAVSRLGCRASSRDQGFLRRKS